MFARFRRNKQRRHSKSSHTAGEEVEKAGDSRCALLADLERIAPGLGLQHLQFAEESISNLHLDKDALTLSDVQRLLYLVGMNPTKETLEEIMDRVLGPLPTTSQPPPQPPQPSAESYGKNAWDSFQRSMSLQFGITPSELRKPEVPGRLLDLRGFLMTWAQYQLMDEGEHELLQQAFRFFDRDGNGHITVQEFQEVMMELGDDKLTKDECELFIQLIDKDGDEEVQIDEFLSALHSKNSGQLLEMTVQTTSEDEGADPCGTNTSGNVEPNRYESAKSTLDFAPSDGMTVKSYVGVEEGSSEDVMDMVPIPDASLSSTSQQAHPDQSQQVAPRFFGRGNSISPLSSCCKEAAL
mmetsp:Transcript_39221/g.75181  ORF Transcript_39221/g.75181 Transcript_39221/m.75181 type:complete len:353 (+) Transcript_39221:442-1500(+)|eukprot:CAMPEP_0114237772 /NCGR_PEP_ID=MMETSP0058-20121206/7569_1 /TAXON_ID=36894 /ORGANISM="Pyramimonas parkeae, CCMP726" /LENGTH=352 /DNA_ID=CAMNT_0001349837 /DNA_START=364 /DNA_END=1422 /DNA_ORIENTATION=-